MRGVGRWRLWTRWEEVRIAKPFPYIHIGYGALKTRLR